MRRLADVRVLRGNVGRAGAHGTVMEAIRKSDGLRVAIKQIPLSVTSIDAVEAEVCVCELMCRPAGVVVVAGGAALARVAT